MAGYSQKSLEKKLGLSSGQVVRLVNVPGHYQSLFTEFPSDLTFEDGPAIKKQFIHAFVENAEALHTLLPALKRELADKGMIWISWPKKSSGISTDIRENDIRNLALSIGLVDVKVCAVDDTWSGLKLVIPLKDRKG